MHNVIIQCEVPYDEDITVDIASKIGTPGPRKIPFRDAIDWVDNYGESDSFRVSIPSYISAEEARDNPPTITEVYSP